MSFGPVVSAERWTRGGGTGIGLSSHVNEFYQAKPGGVLLGNFVEERAYAEPAPSTSGPPPMSTYKSTVCAPFGKVGDELLMMASERHDRNQNDLRWDTLSRHGNFSYARTQDCASMYQMSHGLRGEDVRRVQHYLWQGTKHNDLAVPGHVDTLRGSLPAPLHASTSISTLGTTPSHFGLASFTSRGTGVGSLHGSSRSRSAAPLRPTVVNHISATTSTLLESALLASQLPGGSSMRASLRPTTCSLRGRKPTGPHRDACDLVHHRTGLRTPYVDGPRARV